MLNLGTERLDLGSKRPDLGSERPDLRSARPYIGSERPDFSDLGSERSVLGSERPDLGSKGLHLQSGRLGGDVRTETGENCPMWNHRSSAPPGPLPPPKKDMSSKVAPGQRYPMPFWQ